MNLEKPRSSEWQSRIFQTFGKNVLPSGMFYEFDHALRFELGGEHSVGSPIRRFMQAHSRAKEIAKFVFKHSSKLHALTLSWGNKESPNSDLSRLGCVFPNFNKNNPVSYTHLTLPTKA